MYQQTKKGRRFELSDSDSEKNIVYIAENSCFPGIVKIGITNDLEAEMEALSLAVPKPYKALYACKFSDGPKVEKLLHERFKEYRKRKTDFFEINPQEIVLILKFAELTVLEPNEVVNPKRTISTKGTGGRSPNFSFSAVDIPSGTVINFLGDSTITAEVVSDRKVLFEGSEVSLSKAASIVEERNGRATRSPRGPDFWTYEGETLTERRRRLDAQKAG